MVLARIVGSLAALSAGRVILGVGTGGAWDAIASMGVHKLTPALAVRAMEETIIVMRALCGGGEPVTFEGDVYQLTSVEPTLVPTPPIWTGAVGPKSLAVTGRLADGWIPGHGADWLSARYQESRPLIDAAATAAGREPAEIATIYNFGGPITDSPQPTIRDHDGRWTGGSVAQWIERAHDCRHRARPVWVHLPTPCRRRRREGAPSMGTRNRARRANGGGR